MKATYNVSVVPASDKAAGILANINIVDDRSNKWSLGIFRNSGDIKFRPAWGTEVNPTLALTLMSIKAKLKAGFNAEIVINYGDNGVSWKINNERNIAAEAAAATSSASNVIENAEEAFN
jgi:hypothetical protein